MSGRWIWGLRDLAIPVVGQLKSVQVKVASD